MPLIPSSERLIILSKLSTKHQYCSSLHLKAKSSHFLRFYQIHQESGLMPAFRRHA